MSAYSIFKRPDLIAKGEPFLESCFGIFQAQVHYTPNLAQEINLSRIQRYPSVRGCFDGGEVLTQGCLETVTLRSESGQWQTPQLVGRYIYRVIPLVSPTTTFKAPSGRQLIADKGSFDRGSSRCAIKPGPAPRTITFNAALTERCRGEKCGYRNSDRTGKTDELVRLADLPDSQFFLWGVWGAVLRI